MAGSSTNSCMLNTIQICGLVHTWDSSSKQLLQVIPEQQLVASDFEAGPKEEGSSDAVEHLVWQCVLTGSTPFCPHCLQIVACCIETLGKWQW